MLWMQSKRWRNMQRRQNVEKGRAEILSHAFVTCRHADDLFVEIHASALALFHAK
jgi:hypothetical protein